MNRLTEYALLVRLALRSLLSHRVKTLIVGGLLAGGTFLLVFGTALLSNVERTMAESITSSMTGHIQIHSDKAKDKIAFSGPDAQQQQDLGVIEDFGKVKAALEKVPNVSAVVPMGRDIAMALSGNDFDKQLGELRDAVKSGDTKTKAGRIERIRKLADLKKQDYVNRLAISSAKDEIEAAIATLDRAASDAFWAEFEADPVPQLDWLDTKLAPLQQDDQAIFLAYIGTDPQQYAAKFGNFEIVQGQMIPPGERGLLMSQKYLDETAKQKVAFLLDKMKKALEDGDTFAKDAAQQEKQKRIVRLARPLLFIMSPEDATKLSGELETALGKKGTLEEQLKELVTVDDANFQARYKMFYDLVAPKIELYKMKVGGDTTIRVYTRSGYSRAATLKVWGTFRFKGLDDSLLASRYNVLDIMTFRDLYGLMTPERKKELEAMRAQVGVADVNRDDAESALFGDDSLEAEVVPAEGAAAAAEPAAAEPAAAKAPAEPPKRYTQADIEQGVVLNAAVILHDPSKIAEAKAAIAKVNEEEKLGLKIVDWQEAAGIIGQFMLVLKVLLFITIGFIFLVSLVIINNSMLMATMDRVQEIGTMRAIGAQRGFVLVMFLIETTVLAILAGAGGTGLAAGLLAFLGKVGIPAGHEILVVVFGGPRLFPVLDAGSVAFGLFLIVIVSVAATLYPAIVATRIQPVVAMQKKE